MPSAVPLRTDFSTRELRRLAKQSRDNNQSRRLLSLAAVLDGMSRDDAARIGHAMSQMFQIPIREMCRTCNHHFLGISCWVCRTPASERIDTADGSDHGLASNST